MEWLIEIIKSKIDSKFTGSIELNFFKGGISNVNFHESVKPPNNWKTEIEVRLLKP